MTTADRPNAGDRAARYVPVRMCVICRGRFPKAALQRYVANVLTSGAPEATPGVPPLMVHDPRQRMDGRGHYVCENPICREKFKTFVGRSRKR